MGAGSLLWSLDEAITNLLASWNSYSTGLATVLIGVAIYRVASMRDPDVHPILLARQAEHNRIRNPDESPVYGSRFTEHLTTGLNVRDPPAPGQQQRTAPWARGRDGDLRDVWNQVLLGAEPATRLAMMVAQGGEGEVQQQRRVKGRLVTVLGDAVVESKGGRSTRGRRFLVCVCYANKHTGCILEDVDHQISAIGSHLASNGAKRVAICLPNSVEFVAALFACSFQLITPILVPSGQQPSTLVSMLRDAGADTVLAEPGMFPIDAVAAALPDLRRVLWVTVQGNEHHLDLDKPPAAHVSATTWQDIVAAATPQKTAQQAERHKDKDVVPPEVVMFWQSKGQDGNAQYKAVEYSQANLVAGIAGQLEALPSMVPRDDVLLPADSLANAHTLVVTLAALFANASVAFNAAAATECSNLDLAQLTGSGMLRPTIIVTSPATLIKAHSAYAAKLSSSMFARLSHWYLTRSLVQEGRMPTSSIAAQGDVGSGLRLIITADRAGSDTTPALSSAILSDLRVATGARIVYALAAAPVAGAVAQRMAFDYRVINGEAVAHFGGPLQCLRFFLKDTESVRNSDEKYQGEVSR